MVELYCRLIIGKRKAFQQIPDAMKSDVENRLNELGYDTNGEKIAKED